MRLRNIPFAACAVLIGATLRADIEITSPKDGDVVSQLWPEYKTFLSLTREQRKTFREKADENIIKAFRARGAQAKPVELAWKNAIGPCTVKVERLPDGKVFHESTVTGSFVSIKGRLEVARKWKVTVSDGKSIASVIFSTEDCAPRIISLEGVNNARDLGGRVGLDGRRVKQGLLFRTGGLNHNAKFSYYTYDEIIKLHEEGKLSSAGTWKSRHLGREYEAKLKSGKKLDKKLIRLLKHAPTKPGEQRLSVSDRAYLLGFLGIKTDIDFRDDWECYGMTESPLGDDVKWCHYPWIDPYGGIASPNGRASSARAFTELLKPSNYPIVFHCIGGVDRTGTFAFMLNALLGVDEEELVRDYEMSFIKGAGVDKIHYGWLDSLLKAAHALPGDTLADKFKRYFISLGFTEAQVDKFREFMLESRHKHEDGIAGTMVLSSTFDTQDEIREWRTNEVWKLEKGVGVNGSCALTWTNGDSSKYDVQTHEIKGIRPGMKLRATFKVKVESLSGENLGCTICWNNAKGWMGGAGGTEVKWGDKSLKPDADGWCQMSIKTPYLPAKMTRCYLQLYANRHSTGRILFDDIRVELIGTRSMGGVESVATSGYRGNVADGEDVRIVAGIELPVEYEAPGKAIATLSYIGFDGLRKTADMSIQNAEVAMVALPASMFTMGRQQISVELKGADGRSFGTRNAFFSRVKNVPKRHIAFDEHKRTLIDGKPFFPIGMYWSENTLAKSDSLERYASAGVFNCLQTYEKAMSAEILDRYWSYGLYVIASVKDLYAPPNGPLEKGSQLGFPPPGIITRTDETNYVKRVVERCRNHPALLAWYICDEIPEKYHDRLNDRYSLMKMLDPEHPTFTCICHPAVVKKFLESTDVIGSDPYPVKMLPPDLGNLWEAGDSAETVRNGMAGLLPMWQVPQAFSWRWDYWDNPHYHFPTFKEMRNMVWQQIAAGANGILLYSYGQILNCKEEMEAKEKYFRISCDVALEVRNQIPVLLLAPGPMATQIPERVRVRTWRDDDVAYALICNTHPEPRKGVVRIEGNWKSGIPVFGEGVAFEDGALALDMSPIGVAIVKLYK